MIKHIWSVLCGSSSIDNESNKVSLFNILENLTIYGDPEQVTGIPINVEILTLWERLYEEPCEGFMRIILINPHEIASQPFEFNIDLKEAHFHRTRMAITGLPLSGPGRYVYQVAYKEGETNWQIAAELPILIRFENSENNP